MEAVSQLSPMRRLILIGASIGLLAVVFSQLQLYLRRRRFKRQHGCQPVAKSATRDPILGLDLVERQLRSARDHKALEQARQRFLDCGNTFRMNVLGRPGIATIEPDNVKAVLAVNFDDYGVGHRLLTFGPLLGAGIFDTDGKHWAMSRSLIRPNFTREQVADLAAFEKLIHDLLAHIPRDGETTVDLQNLFFRYTIDSATEFLFGHSVGSLREGAATSELSFSEAFNYAQEAIRTRNIMGPLRFLHRDQKADRCNKLCRSFAQQFVDKAVAAVEAEKKAGVQDDKYVFAHELARRTSDKQRILDELMNVLLAGRDTTASLLSNMFFMLAKNPPMWDKLRQEVASLEGRVPTYAELRNLKYLKCCMNECKTFSPNPPPPPSFSPTLIYRPVGKKARRREGGEQMNRLRQTNCSDY